MRSVGLLGNFDLLADFREGLALADQNIGLPQLGYDLRISWRLGKMYSILGDHRAAILHLARSYQLRRELFGERNSPTTYTKNYLALERKQAGEYAEAERLFDELIELRERLDPENNDVLPGYKCNLAGVYAAQSRYEKAEQQVCASMAITAYIYP